MTVADAPTPAPVALEPLAAAGARRSPARTATVLAVPVLVLVAIVVAVAGNGDRILRGFGHNPPSPDELVVDRVEFHDGRRVEVEVSNPQSAAITIAHVTIDAAILNDFRIEGGGRSVGSHDQRTLVLEYDWIQDDPYLVGLVSSTGVTTEVAVAAAVPAASPEPGGLGWGALIGVLVGFVPIALGLAWLPALRQLSPRAVGGFLAFTAGLLVFLAIEATAEALDTQALLVPAIGGPGLVAAVVVASMVAIAMTGRVLRRVVGGSDGGVSLGGGVLAVLIAVGIGVHNLGEGLAIGSSFAAGEASLAISLVIGFLVHNITEGLGIASPFARSGQRLGVRNGLLLALLAGLPAVLGIWAGRYVGGQLFATVCFSIAAGAAAQVVVEIVRSLRRDTGNGGLASIPVQVGFAAGLVVMWITGTLAG